MSLAALWLAQLMNQCSCLREVGEVKAIREPLIDRRKKVARAVELFLIAPQPGEAVCRTQFE